VTPPDAGSPDGGVIMQDAGGVDGAIDGSTTLVPDDVIITGCSCSTAGLSGAAGGTVPAVVATALMAIFAAVFLRRRS
jgi:hypothetical protein